MHQISIGTKWSNCCLMMILFLCMPLTWSTSRAHLSHHHLLIEINDEIHINHHHEAYKAPHPQHKQYESMEDCVLTWGMILRKRNTERVSWFNCILIKLEKNQRIALCQKEHAQCSIFLVIYQFTSPHTQRHEWLWKTSSMGDADNFCHPRGWWFLHSRWWWVGFCAHFMMMKIRGGGGWSRQYNEKYWLWTWCVFRPASSSPSS